MIPLELFNIVLTILILIIGLTTLSKMQDKIDARHEKTISVLIDELSLIMDERHQKTISDIRGAINGVANRTDGNTKILDRIRHKLDEIYTKLFTTVRRDNEE